MVKAGLLASAMLTLAAAAPQGAQNLPGLGNFTLPPSLPTPTPSPTPVGPVISLPTLTPTPAPTPTPRATPLPRATPSPKATPTPRASPSSRATPSPHASESPRPAASPTPAVSPTASPIPSTSAIAPAPVPLATPTSSPRPTATPSPAPTSSGASPLWPVAGLIVLLALLGGAALWWKRRRDSAPERPAVAKRPTPPRPKPTAKQPVAAPPASKPTDPLSEAPSFWTPSKPAHLPEPVAPPPPPARPRIEIGIDPRRAGLNLLSATAEVEVLLRNEGDAIATGIAIDVRLLNAQSEQDSQLGVIFASAMTKSAVPSFEIAPGEEQAIRAVATLPRDAIVPLTAAGRPMFVPVISVDARYDRGDGGRGQTAAAFVIGVVRDGNDKLAPFWLDTAPRMFDTVAARPHSFSVRS